MSSDKTLGKGVGMTTGEKLRKLRGNRSQAEIAELLGVSTSAISMYELGERVPRRETMKAISRLFDVSVEELFFADTGE